MNLQSLNINKILKTIFSIKVPYTNYRIMNSIAVVEDNISSINSICPPHLPSPDNTSNEIENQVANNKSR